MVGKTKKPTKQQAVEVIAKSSPVEDEEDPMDAMEEPKNMKKRKTGGGGGGGGVKKEKTASNKKQHHHDEEHHHHEEKTSEPIQIPVLPAIHFHTYSLPALKKLIPTVDDSSILFKYLKQAKKLADSNPESGTHAAKVRVLEKRLSELIEAGKVVRERRIPGTGKQVEKEFVYADNAENDKKKRVGQVYKKLVWEGCQYEKVPVSRLLHKKRRHSSSEPGGVEGEEPVAKKTRPPTAWIRALKQARTDLGVGKKFVPVCNPAVLAPENLANPTETQKLGIKLYDLARKYQDEIKKAEGKDAAEPPPVVASA